MKKAPATTAKRLKKHITPRHRRLILALLTGPLHREDADRVSGASNSPHYVRDLRDNFGLNITTERVDRIDRDGQKTRPGIYALEPDSIELAELLLAPDGPEFSEADAGGADNAHRNGD